MAAVEPFFREAGTGPGVVCFHANASSSTQWRELMELLAPRCHVLATDGYGAGKSPPWPADRIVTLDDEVDLAEPVLARAGAPRVLIGHSYGGAVALIAAMRHPERVRAMVLYEPTLFALLDAETPPPNEADGIRATVAAAARALDAHDMNAAAEYFIDYWMGAGVWQRMSEQRKPAIATAMTNVRGWAHALLSEPTPLTAFASLNMPVLYLTGQHSPASSLGVAHLLTGILPNVEWVALAGLGHMGPITHPQVVNPLIETFLGRI